MKTTDCNEDVMAGLAPATTSAPKVGSSALVRHCNKCLAVTALDLDATCANEKALRLRGQTVRIMDAAEVLGMKLEHCKCLPNVKGQ